MKKKSLVGWCNEEWWIGYLRNEILGTNPLHIPQINRYKEYSNIVKVRITIEEIK